MVVNASNPLHKKQSPTDILLKDASIFSKKMSGPQCCENPPTLSSSSGAGVVHQFGGFSTYITGPPHAKAAVLLISDVYGYEAPKLRKIADKVGAAGFYVVVPDFLRGDPYVHDQTVFEWLKDHSPTQGAEDAKPVIEALKAKGMTKVGAAGFCWGGKVVVELAKCSYIEAGVLVHSSFVTAQDVEGTKVPLSILGAETDHLCCPPELMKQFEAALNAKPEIDSFVKIFPGVAHGWTVRYKDDDEFAVKSADEAHKDLLDWFIKHLN